MKQQPHRAQGVDLRSEGVSLWLLAATSELPQRPDPLRKSVDPLQASGDRMELARAPADLGEAYRDKREPVGVERPAADASRTDRPQGHGRR
ncbi:MULTISPECIES: hypothetical protein [unclassified Streptomyces]|uniref:hypothetical protein n=1 Tax=unclassified Streptomyces TaxID=2593676 RepID=UPI0036610F92